MLGVRPAAGRLFRPAEDAPGASPTAILSYGAWTRRFGGRRNALGRTLTLNGAPYTITGILPRGFSLPREVMPTLGGAEDAEVFLPLPLAASAAGVRTHEDYNLIGRLQRGVRLTRAQAGMDGLTARLRRDHADFYPPNGGLTFSIVPLLEQVVGDSRRAILILAGAVACVLLIACANLANLLLARALGPLARDGAARRARRIPRAPHPATADRKPRALASRRRAGRPARRRNAARHPPAWPGQRAAPRRHRGRRPGPALHGRPVVRRRYPVRTRAGLSALRAPDLHAVLKSNGLPVGPRQRPAPPSCAPANLPSR